MTTLHELSDRFSRLPIAEENAGIFEALLRLPFDLYRPVMDMLLDGTLVVEDLFQVGPDPSGRQTAAASADAAEAAALALRWSADIDDDSLRRNVASLLAGGRPAALTVPRDNGMLLAGPDGGPSGAFVPGGVTILGPDATATLPGPIERDDAALSGEDARKVAQRTLSSALAGELD